MCKWKRWVSFLLSMAMIFSVIPLGRDVAAAEIEQPSQTDPEPENVRISGTCGYPSFGGLDYRMPFFYDDNYFTVSGYDYQDSLATMTLCMSLTAFGSNLALETKEGYKHKSRNLENLLSDCGFPAENYETNQSFREKPGMDSIGVGVSSKQIMDDGEACTLIAAAVRGGGYEAEWASNFTLGPEGKHQGFREARDQVLSYLSKYIDSHGISGRVKLWITGYSRAAATTNLVAGALDEGYVLSNAITLDRDDLFAYCFECPQGATDADNVDDPKFGNIFNIVNPSDIVTKIAPSKPEQFGFQRYGVNCYLPTALKEGEAYPALLDAMLKQYRQIPSTSEYVVDDFQMKKVVVQKKWQGLESLAPVIIVDDEDEKWDQNAFLDELVFRLFNDSIKTRKLYVETYEQDMRELCKLAFGSSDKWVQFPDLVMGKLEEQAEEIATCLLLRQGDRLAQILEQSITEALKELHITDYSLQDIKTMAQKLADLFLPFGMQNPDLAVTLICNLHCIGYAHVPEVCLAWLRSFDPNYNEDAESSFNSGVHRILRVNGPVDVLIRDQDGNPAAAIVNGESVEVADDAIVSYANEDGEMSVYLPAEQGYEAQLFARSDGLVTYCVQEYSEKAGGITRIVNYYDVPVSEKDIYTGMIPALDPESEESDAISGSQVSYPLAASEGSPMVPNVDLAGGAAMAGNCKVDISINDDTLGSVSGGGVVKVGSYVTLTAVPAANCRFEGWFCEDALVSEALNYRLRIDQDLKIEARFDLMEDTGPSEPEESTEPSEPEESTAPSEPEQPSEPHVHEFGEWEVVKEPTATEEGEAQRRCACGAVETKVLPRLSNPFTDVAETDYFYEPVLWAVSHGITAGVGENQFGPLADCTRSQIVTFLWKAMGAPEPHSAENPFKDVPADSYYVKPVLWAVENGITSGVGDGLFGPEQLCTRSQIVTFLWKAMGSPEPQSAENPFKDVPADSYYAKPVLWAVENGITSGVGSGLFGPLCSCTRSQAVTFLWKAVRMA